LQVVEGTTIMLCAQCRFHRTAGVRTLLIPFAGRRIWNGGIVYDTQ